MNIYLHLSIHLILSFVPGIIAWRIWGKKWPAIIAGVIGGALIDLDHFIEYFLVFGWHFNYQYFMKGYQFLGSEYAYVIFHAWEYVAILLFLVLLFKNKTLKTILFALALGFFVHLMADSIINDLSFATYSIIYRAKNEFQIERLSSPRSYAKHLKDREWFMNNIYNAKK